MDDFYKQKDGKVMSFCKTCHKRRKIKYKNYLGAKPASEKECIAYGLGEDTFREV